MQTILPSLNVVEVFFCQSKEDNVLSENKMRLVARQKIEVVPFDKTEFDFINFIDFSKATKSSYCSTELKRNKKKKHIFANLFPRKQSINNVQNKYAFQIILGDEMESIHVYVKYNMLEFKYTNHQNVECIYLKYESNHPCNIFVNPNKVNDDSLLYQTAKYFNNGKYPCHECIKNYFFQYKGRFQKNQSLINQKCDTRTILSCCTGYVTIYHKNNSLETGEETSETFIQCISICSLKLSFHFSNSYNCALSYSKFQ